MSVPSLKTIVTTETPNFEIDRISSTLGSPLIAPSTGNDRSDSTSIGESDGASVITWPCTLVRSGTASIGRYMAERTPRPATSALAPGTKNRLLSDDSMMELSIWVFRFRFSVFGYAIPAGCPRIENRRDAQFRRGGWLIGRVRKPKTENYSSSD